MIVKGTSDGNLLLELGIGDNQKVPEYFRRPQNNDSPLDCKADFQASDLTAKMQISSTVDLFTALKDRFVGVTERSMPCIGVPLVIIYCPFDFFIFSSLNFIPLLLSNLIEVFAIVC
jgi:hypothetical protein